MLALPDLQRGVRDALILGDISRVESALRGGQDPRQRLAIHQRHYRASLVMALLDRFPATVWLVGSDRIRGAAEQFARDCPPSMPCVAEYGGDFPHWLASQAWAAALPYLKQFAELEWHLSRLSVAIDKSAVPLSALSTMDAATLTVATIEVQPCVHYLHADWPVDRLISVHLSDNPPDRFVLEPDAVWLEIRGARGEIRMTRLTQPVFAFRAALGHGAALGDAAVAALDVAPTFDPGLALFDLFSEGLVVTVHVPSSGYAA